MPAPPPAATPDAKAPAFIQVQRAGHLTVITINRPEVLNALHPPASAELGAAFDAFAADAEAWVAILTGAGTRAFSAGNDLKVAAGGAAFQDLRWNGGFGGITARHDLDKPVIAAVNGVAMGGGFEVALACDLIVCDEKARFGLPEPRVGFVANAGGMVRLPRIIPEKRALGMLLTGKPIDAAEAQRLGLVNEVTPAGEALAGARRWAAEILECAPLNVRLSKQIARDTAHLPVAQAMAADPPLMRVYHESEDRQEGPRAFVEKRKPQWKGR